MFLSDFGVIISFCIVVVHVLLCSNSHQCHGFSSPSFARSSIIALSQLKRNRKGNRHDIVSLYVKEEVRQVDDLQTKPKKLDNINIDIETNEETNTETQLYTNTNTITSSIKQNITQNIFLSIQPTPELLAILSIYFVEGALSLSKLAQTFYLKDTLHLSPSGLSALTGLFTLPWTIKPLYGFLSDGVSLFGYRRKSYLIICGLVGAGSYWALGSNFWDLIGNAGDSGDVVDGVLIKATIASFVLSSACIAFSDVVADGIVVQRTRDSNDPKVAGKFNEWRQSKWKQQCIKTISPWTHNNHRTFDSISPQKVDYKVFVGDQLH